MRKTHLKIRPRIVRGERRWEVTLPQQGGGRRRRYFADKKSAEAFLGLASIQAENYGTASLSINDRLRIDAQSAQEILAPYGKTITDAATFYVAHLEQISASRPIETVVSALLAARQSDGLSKRYLKDLKNRLARFADDFRGRTVASITAGEIDSWLRTLSVGPLTRNTFRLRLSTLWEFALVNKWATENPLSSVAKAKIIDSPIGILAPEQLAHLLEASNEDTLLFWAIGAFAGLRSAELERLEWNDIHFDRGFIEIKAAKSKTRARRFITVQPALRAWLELYKGKFRKGKVFPRGLRMRLEMDRKKAGLFTWPSNALRHSYGSYHLEFFKNAAQTALEMGHRNQDLLFAHYRELVTPEAAKQYWSIMPAETSKMVPLQTSA